MKAFLKLIGLLAFGTAIFMVATTSHAEAAKSAPVVVKAAKAKKAVKPAKQAKEVKPTEAPKELKIPKRKKVVVK